MKRILTGVITLLMLALCGCGAKMSQAESIRRQYGAIASAQMEAEVVCHLTGESRTYTLTCAYDGEKADTTVTAPERLAGVTATVSPDGLEVTYEGMSLPAGELSDICPANCLPYLLHAVGDGYLLEQSREELRGIPCQRLTLDTTARSGKKVLCTVWIDDDTLVPRYAEFTQDEKTVLTVDMKAFACTVGEITED